MRHARDVVHRLLRRQRDARGLGVEAHQPGALVLGAEALLHQAIPDFARGAVLGNLLEEIVVRVEEEAEARAELVDIEPAAPRPLHVLDAVVDGECQLLQRGRAGLANVIAADGNGVEARRELGAELEGVDHQPHRRRRRIDVFLLRDVFLQDVVLDGAGNLLPVRALLLGDRQIHRPQDRCRRVDGHRDRGLLQVDAVEEDLHVLQRIDGHAALADLALAERMVAVVAHQRGQIEGDRQSAAAVRQQIFVALVGLLRRGEAGELAHGPHLAAIAGGVNAARVRRLAGIVQVLFVLPVCGKIGGRVQPANRHAGDGGEARVPCSSRLMPVGAPIGFSGAFSSVGASVFSAHCFSDSEGWRPALEQIGDRRFRYSFPVGLAGCPTHPRISDEWARIRLVAVGHSLPHSKTNLTC